MNKTIAQKIRRLRQNRDFSQDNVADELGISKGAYSKIERGITAISVDRLAQIAQILNVTIDVFFRDIKNKGIMEEHLPEYGFATKSDIEELARMIAAFGKELNDFKEEMSVGSEKKNHSEGNAKKK